MTPPTPPLDGEGPSLLGRALLVALVATSALHVLHAALGWEGARSGLTAGLGLAAIAGAVRLRRAPDAEAVPVMGLFALAQGCLFALHLLQAPVPFELRPLLVGLLAGYAALAVVLVGAAFPRADAGGVVSLAVVTAGVVLLMESEAVWSVLHLGGGDAQAPDVAPTIYRGPLARDPELGEIPVPGTLTESLYPTNPRGYFSTRDVGWGLNVQSTSAATMDADGGAAAVRIDRADDPTPWHIQLDRMGYRLEGGEEYTLRFDVRATGARAYAFSVGMAHEPWEALGLYQTDTATREWTRIERRFRALKSDPQVRVSFQLGGDTADVSVRGVRLTGSQGEEERTVGQVEHYVQYRWNSRGCRDREYAVPAPPGTFRIVALGDSYTQGSGVHAHDVFTSRLEALLNARAEEAGDPTTYEVVNCGVTGFATREERLYYELRAREYRPDLVLVTMVGNDDQSFLDDVRDGRVSAPSRWEILLRTVRLAKKALRRPVERDFTRSAREMAELEAEVRRDGAELALVLFRNLPGPDWDRLAEVADSTARDLGVPVLDLQPLFLGKPIEEMVVHPGDLHPNEHAHDLAARAILSWLEEEELVGGPPDAGTGS